MMQNTSILNHPESIIEMQLAGLIFFYTINARWEEAFGHGLQMSEPTDDAIVNFGQSYKDFSLTLLFFMLVEHILSYIFTYVKRNDILKRGTVGADGVESTPVCKILDIVSACI